MAFRNASFLCPSHPSEQVAESWTQTQEHDNGKPGSTGGQIIQSRIEEEHQLYRRVSIKVETRPPPLEKQCFCVSKSTPIPSEDVCLLARGVPARHNSAAAGWRLAAAELCRSCRLLRWSLSVSVARAVINHGRVGECSGPPRSPQHSARPDLNGRITARMMSGLKTTDQRQCLIIAQGHPGLSAWTRGKLIVWCGTAALFALETDTSMCVLLWNTSVTFYCPVLLKGSWVTMKGSNLSEIILGGSPISHFATTYQVEKWCHLVWNDHVT